MTNRDSIMVEMARRKREREPQPARAGDSGPLHGDKLPAPMSAIATDPFSRLPDAFPQPSYEALHDEPTHTKSAFPVMHFASGRRYDATLAFIQAMAGPLEPADLPNYGTSEYNDTPAHPRWTAEATNVDSAELERLAALAAARPPPPPGDDDYEDAPTQVTSRPPPFVPMVRPSPPARKGPETIDQGTLTAMVDTSMLVAQPDGSAAFEIAFDDEVFQNLACTIAVGPSGVVATFRAPDVNTRRLLEAEAGRLRVRLSERGLRVAEVRVESE